MKKNNQGFMLAEVFVISSIVLVILVTMYTQFRNINRSYETSFKYNTVTGLYAIDNINKFIKNDAVDKLKENLNSNLYIDLSTCDSLVLNNPDMCNTLKEKLNIKTILLTKNVDGLKTSELNYNRDFIKFIKTIKGTDSYITIIEFNDNSYSTLNLKI